MKFKEIEIKETKDDTEQEREEKTKLSEELAKQSIQAHMDNLRRDEFKGLITCVDEKESYLMAYRLNLPECLLYALKMQRELNKFKESILKDCLEELK